MLSYVTDRGGWVLKQVNGGGEQSDYSDYSPRSASLQALWSAHSKFKFGFGKQSGSLEGWLLTSTW